MILGQERDDTVGYFGLSCHAGPIGSFTTAIVDGALAGISSSWRLDVGLGMSRLVTETLGSESRPTDARRTSPSSTRSRTPSRDVQERASSAWAQASTWCSDWGVARHVPTLRQVRQGGGMTSSWPPTRPRWPEARGGRLADGTPQPSG